MEYDLVQMLAEPGTRQLVVGGCAAVLGAARMLPLLYNNYKEYRHKQTLRGMCGELKESAMMMGLDPYVVEQIRKEKEEAKLGNKWVSRLCWGLPAVLGLEQAISNSNPVRDSYLLESVSDIAGAYIGYGVGLAAMVMVGVVGCIATIKGIDVYQKMNTTPDVKS